MEKKNIFDVKNTTSNTMEDYYQDDFNERIDDIKEFHINQFNSISFDGYCPLNYIRALNLKGGEGFVGTLGDNSLYDYRKGQVLLKPKEWGLYDRYMPLVPPILNGLKQLPSALEYILKFDVMGIMPIHKEIGKFQSMEKSMGKFLNKNMNMNIFFDVIGLIGDHDVKNGSFPSRCGQDAILYPTKLMNGSKLNDGEKVELEIVPLDKVIDNIEMEFWKSINNKEILKKNRADAENLQRDDKFSFIDKAASEMFITLKAMLAKSIIMLEKYKFITINTFTEASLNENGKYSGEVVDASNDKILSFFGYKGDDEKKNLTLNTFLLNLFTSASGDFDLKDIDKSLHADSENGIQKILKNSRAVQKMIDSAYVGKFLNNAEPSDDENSNGIRLFFNVTGK